MPVVITIGYSHYLVSSKKDAATIVTALAGAIKLDRDYVDRKEVFFPDERQTEIGMRTIMSDQLVRTKPPEKEDIIEQPAPKVPKQLRFDGGAK